LRSSRASLPEEAQQQVDKLLAARKVVTAQLKAIAKTFPSGIKTRIHGDYHLGQVLISKDDVIIIDFEGEPRRSLAERREKSSPLRDVAGMLRSFDYAASAALERLSARKGQLPEQAVIMATAWRDRAAKDFLEAYCRTAPVIFGPSPTAASLLSLFLLQKAFYEIGYERANRPAWLPIPLLGVLDLLDGRGPRWP
jgi:maltose alpha-D-glucosyltransferase/alpha-amylase